MTNRECKRRDDIFRAKIAHQLCLLNMRKKDLIGKMGLPESTFYAKMKSPEKFTLGEIRIICEILRLSIDIE